MVNESFFTPPVDAYGDRDYRTEINEYVKKRARGVGGADQGFVIVCETLLNEIDRLRKEQRKHTNA